MLNQTQSDVVIEHKSNDSYTVRLQRQAIARELPRCSVIKILENGLYEITQYGLSVLMENNSVQHYPLN